MSFDRYDRPFIYNRDRDDGRDVYRSCQPVKRRVGAGDKARVTVETGGDKTKYREELRREKERLEKERHEKEVMELRLANARLRSRRPRSRHRERYGRPTLYNDQRYSSRRRDSYSSPSPRPKVSGSDASPSAGSAGGRWSAVSSSEEYDDYDFDLGKMVNAVTFTENVAIRVLDSGSTDFPYRAASTAKSKFSGAMTEVSILQSRWSGSTIERGELGAEIVTQGSNAPSEKQHPAAMKWYHLERAMMSYEEFMAAAQSVLQMPDRELRDVSKLLRDVQKRFEKQRHHGRDLEPDVVFDSFLDGDRQTSSVLFLSFPYFCLAPYAAAEIRALSPGSAMHPIRPMLQAHFYSTSQTRELAQVISTMPGTTAGDCVHIAQVWALLVNGSIMITCSKLNLGILCGETIKQLKALSTDSDTTVKVTIYSDRHWLIPISNETTWPAFLSLFGDKLANLELQGTSARFEYKDAAMSGKLWPDLVAKARRGPVELNLKDERLRVGEYDAQFTGEADPNESDQAADPRTAQPKEDATTIGAHRNVPVPGISPRNASTIPLEKGQTLQLFKHAGSSSYMRTLADSLHNTLLSNNRAQERVAYKKCPASKVVDIDRWLASHDEQAQDVGTTRDAAYLIKCKRRLASVLKYLFSLFWPVGFEHAVTEKWWGALQLMMDREGEIFEQGRHDGKADIAYAKDIYAVLHDEILPLAQSLTREYWTYEKDIVPLPDAWLQAWLHLHTSLVLMAGTPLSKRSYFGDTPVNKHLHSAVSELGKGRQAIASRLRTAELEDLEVCSESSLLALILSNVARDVMQGRPGIATSYKDYFQSLEFNITEDPKPRTHQETLRFFLQEVEAILATLQHQMSVVVALQQSLEQQCGEDYTPLLYALGESRQSRTIEECKAWIGSRIDKFKGLQQRANDIGEWHRNSLENTKDRQENAILVFTIVTIIFLPLSFVASVFGMNTKDVRDMSYNQWAYWAAGVPLTIVVIGLSLWVAGEFEDFGRWLAKIMSRSKKKTGYEKLDDVDGDVLERRRRNARDRYDEEDISIRPRRRTTYPLKD